MIDLYDIFTNNVFLDIIFNVLMSTSGGGNVIQDEIVRYLISTSAFVILFSIAILHRISGFFNKERDNLIIWGFGICLIYNIILLTLSITTYSLSVVHIDIINPYTNLPIHIHNFVNTGFSSFLVASYIPLSHFLHMSSMLFISMALIRYVVDETPKERKFRYKYIIFCLCTSFFIYLISLNPNLLIYVFGCSDIDNIIDYIWHISSISLLIYPMYLIHIEKESWITNVIIVLFGMYLLYDVGKLLELFITHDSIIITNMIRNTLLNITPLIMIWIFIKESVLRLEEQTISSKTLLEVQELFITGTSHELASPIAGMEGYLKILEKQYNILGSEAPIEECNKSIICTKIPVTIETLKEGIQHIKSILRIMKDYGHTKDYNEIKLYDINILTKKCYDAIQFADTTKKIPKENFLFYDNSSVNNYMVRLSPYKYRQIIENLVNNAVRAVTIKQPEIPIVTITLQCTYAGCIVTIEDNGIGMSEDDLKHCFQKKWTTFENQGGTGLGLYFVRKYIEELNGTIHINSIKEEGTTVRFLLPTELNEN